MKSKSNYEKRLEYNNTYNRNNYRSFSMRLHNENEADLIEWIESQDSVKEYLLLSFTVRHNETISFSA